MHDKRRELCHVAKNLLLTKGSLTAVGHIVMHNYFACQTMSN